MQGLDKRLFDVAGEFKAITPEGQGRQLNEVNDLLSSGANPNVKYRKNYTAFTIALLRDKSAIALAILQAQNFVNVNTKDTFSGATALHYIAQHGYLDLLEQLRHHPKFDSQCLDAVDNQRCTALLRALMRFDETHDVALKKDAVALAILEDEGFHNVNAINYAGSNALHYIAIGYKLSNQLALLSRLCAHSDLDPASLDAADRDGFTPIMRAIANSHIDAAEIIADHPSFSPHPESETLHYCARLMPRSTNSERYPSYQNLFVKLVQKGANLKQRNAEGQRPLDLLSDEVKEAIKPKILQVFSEINDLAEIFLANYLNITAPESYPSFVPYSRLQSAMTMQTSESLSRTYQSYQAALVICGSPFQAFCTLILYKLPEFKTLPADKADLLQGLRELLDNFNFDFLPGNVLQRLRLWEKALGDVRITVAPASPQAEAAIANATSASITEEQIYSGIEGMLKSAMAYYAACTETKDPHHSLPRLPSL